MPVPQTEMSRRLGHALKTRSVNFVVERMFIAASAMPMRSMSRSSDPGSVSYRSTSANSSNKDSAGLSASTEGESSGMQTRRFTDEAPPHAHRDPRSGPHRPDSVHRAAVGEGRG